MNSCCCTSALNCGDVSPPETLDAAAMQQLRPRRTQACRPAATARTSRARPRRRVATDVQNTARIFPTIAYTPARGGGALVAFPRRALSDHMTLPFSPGTHVVAARTLYAHHGIYLGNGRVVHYAGLCNGWQSGPVEEVSLEQFANGERVLAIKHSSRSFSNSEVVARARSRLGENMYHILRNNCEHFCEWCVTGHKRSWQVHKWMSLPRRLLRAVFRRVVDAGASASTRTRS